MSNFQEKRVTRSALVKGYRLDKVGRGPGQRARRKRGSYLHDQSVGGSAAPSTVPAVGIE